MSERVILCLFEIILSCILSRIFENKILAISCVLIWFMPAPTLKQLTLTLLLMLVVFSGFKFVYSSESSYSEQRCCNLSNLSAYLSKNSKKSFLSRSLLFLVLAIRGFGDVHLIFGLSMIKQGSPVGTPGQSYIHNHCKRYEFQPSSDNGSCIVGTH